MPIDSLWFSCTEMETGMRAGGGAAHTSIPSAQSTGGSDCIDGLVQAGKAAYTKNTRGVGAIYQNTGTSESLVPAAVLDKYGGHNVMNIT